MALLDGSSDVVTPQVRMKTYLTLVFVLAHHDGVDDAEGMHDIIFRGLADINRSVRLSAGYVCPKLGPVCTLTFLSW